MSWLIIAGALLLGVANGANDNFKGVATIFGSATTSYRTALAWATVSTLAGSALALALAGELVETFSGSGLVPDETAESGRFLIAVAIGAGLTVLLASATGLPISTTHALVGALVGTGLAAVPSAVDPSVLSTKFLLPLILGPALAIALAGGLYPIARRRRRGRRAIGLSVRRGIDAVHFLSAGAVSFARGLNDTPKIAALLIGAGAVGAEVSVWAIGLAIALGGALGARRVAETMSHRITSLTRGQGLVSNLSAAFLVTAASRYGLPVSTTHVTNGGLFAIGAETGEAHWGTIGRILLAWLTTLPIAAAFASSAWAVAGLL